MSAGPPFPRGKLLLATRNQGKLRELTVLLAELSLELIGLDDLEGVPELEETGTTFADNALQKARAAVAATGLAAAADDSGLCVDALDGAPGVFSARFAGPEADPARNNQLLLERLRDLPAAQRSAHFVCAAALVLPDGREQVVEGTVAGTILDQPRGSGGFGYDPLFFYEPFGTSFGEASAAAKNRISHRGLAFAQLAVVVREMMAGAGGG